MRLFPKLVRNNPGGGGTPHMKGVGMLIGTNRKQNYASL